jgi:hypothetical protein
MILPFLPTLSPVIDPATRLVTIDWLNYFVKDSDFMTSLQMQVSQIPGSTPGGVGFGTIANVPTGLGAADAGRLFDLTDYGHRIMWTGAVWTFAPGDIGNGFLRPHAVVPQEVGWQECDGTVTNYLTLGAAVTVTAFTTPNLKGTPAVLLSGAVYTGTLPATVTSGGTIPALTARWFFRR